MSDQHAEDDGDQYLDIKVAVPGARGRDDGAGFDVDRHDLPLHPPAKTLALALASGRLCARDAPMSATLVSNLGWYPGSWRGRPARQMPTYANQGQLNAVERRLAAAAPVIAMEDGARLRRAMADLA